MWIKKLTGESGFRMRARCRETDLIKNERNRNRFKNVTENNLKISQDKQEDNY
jgi:hypothetical protein